ncbi:MAG: response regulator transcription factor [Methanothrix sp.]|nr:response regulator transcription factor [Methanothrix sp.]
MPIASQILQPSPPETLDKRVSASPAISHKENTLEIPQPAIDQAFRVLIVDRDSMSSDLLVNALARDNQCNATTIHPLELLRALATQEIDLVVIGAELQTETGSGYELAHTISRRYPDLSIVILLHITTQDSVIRAFRSGARGVFSRQQLMNEFFDCVEHVRKGYIWAGRQETNLLVDAFKSIPTFNLVSQNDSPALTAREMQVVRCAAKGKTNRAIANELNLSEHTVKNYLFRAFEKLGVSSRVELLFYLNLQGHIFNTAREEELDVGQGTA